MSNEELKQALLDFMKKSSSKGKKKLYAKDLAKGVADNFDRREAKKMIQEMLTNGDLSYWSSGSTTYVMLPEDFAELQKHETGED